eukprot:scaffold252372_cov26-Tisochrysis_lutea.AAC.3
MNVTSTLVYSARNPPSRQSRCSPPRNSGYSFGRDCIKVFVSSIGTSAVRTVAVQAAPESAKARKSAGCSAISRWTGDVPSGPKTGSRPRREAARSRADGLSSGGSFTSKVELSDRPEGSTRVGRSVDGSNASISDETEPIDPASRMESDEP